MSTPVYHSDRNNEYAGSYYRITYLLTDKWYTFYENFSDEEYFPYEIRPKGNAVNQKIQRMRDRHDAKTGEYDRGDVWQGFYFHS